MFLLETVWRREALYRILDCWKFRGDEVALKKSGLYSSRWSSCDELRGGIDASQYKDYVLVLLFIKYVSDKYAGPCAPIKIPTGASFKDMVALKGKRHAEYERAKTGDVSSVI